MTGVASSNNSANPPGWQVSDLPQGLARPARRALAGAGIYRLEQLAGFSEAGLMQLHGIGPKAIDLLRRALASQDLSLGP